MTQLDLFGETHQQQFDSWVHTTQGGHAMNRFIRLAIGVQSRGKKVGAKAIVERLRWSYEVSKAYGEEYAINNNYTAYMARFAMERSPGLRGFFNVRAAGKVRRGTHVYVVKHTA